ncbi:hypothetical protein A4G29_20380 [Mycobacterium kansasii]|nr:hypothetical protein A4G29_20380 [Mycobacterium kansasii]
MASCSDRIPGTLYSHSGNEVPIAGMGVGSADAVWFGQPAHSQRDGAGPIGAVGADAVVGVGAGAGVCFGSGLVDRGGVSGGQ